VESNSPLPHPAALHDGLEAYPSAAAMRARRTFFAALVCATVVALGAFMAYALGGDGLDAVDTVILAAFVITLPWSAVGFWNAAIGLLLMLRPGDPARHVMPALAHGARSTPVGARTAILVCTRNEDPHRVARNLDVLMAGLTACMPRDRVSVYLLSDTNRDEIGHEEERVVEALRARHAEGPRLVYRRRTENPGFKAGNIRDFCERWGRDHDFAVVLDADSVMSAETVAHLVRVMQADPTLGIAQTLVVGLPSASPFARVFQFGMRLGMRSYTLGSAWWQGDCGPYWGHNAIIRLAPFIEHCHLPRLPGTGPLSGWILSHDQVEAVLMRRAGFAVRVIPVEDGSWEENPPTLLEFIRRDLRWCQGNMQYWRLLGLPGLRPVSRFQLVLAILMFIGSPAWMLMIAAMALRDRLVDATGPAFRPEAGGWLLAIILTMVFAPKIASVVATILDARARREFGGLARFLPAVALETVFSTVLAPIMAVAHTVFLGGLALGRAIGWTTAVRDDHQVPLGAATRRLWVPTLAGAVMLSWFAYTMPGLVHLCLPVAVPLLACVPFAMLTASPALGRWMARAGVAATPDETTPAPELLRLGLPALEARWHAGEPTPATRQA
jgi:membrane glycosyltransferase